MRRLWIAIRAFFATLFYRDVAREVERVLKEASEPAEAVAERAEKPERAEKAERAAKPQRKKPPAPVRSDALTLLATLQREARFIDFIQEPLDSYSDAQIGAAARDVHRDCARVLDRLFALRPIAGEEEGTEVEVPPGFEAARYRLTGNVAGEPPFRGRLKHPGWEATQVELPSWSGTEAAARTIAPVEVELP
jgi:hypothetical protein